MNIYSKKQRWKILLLIAALLIAIASFWFTHNLTSKLAEEERKKVELWATGMKQLAQTNNLNSDHRLILEIIENNETVPVILADENSKVLASRNLRQHKSKQEIIREMKEEHEPIVIRLPGGENQYIYYKDSNLLTQLFYFPIIQLGVVGLFLLVSYYAFSSARKAEQNQVWVGMSKETAHQLGTPTSSLMANLELLKMKMKDQTIVQEIEKDVNRLKKITDRFSKIGSQPVIQQENIIPILQHTIQYLKSRSPRKTVFSNNFEEYPQLYAPINKPLFEWVIENITKNAIDSMNGKGTVHFHIAPKEQLIFLDIRDEGIGIPKAKQKTIFQPGYTTKKRGWGLGLSLAKRIIETYHKGKIFVYSSEPKKGTTLRIVINRKNNHIID